MTSRWILAGLLGVCLGAGAVPAATAKAPLPFVGTVSTVDRVNRTLELGGTRFDVPSDVPALRGLVVGDRVIVYREIHEGQTRVYRIELADPE